MHLFRIYLQDKIDCEWVGMFMYVYVSVYGAYIKYLYKMECKEKTCETISEPNC